MNSKAQDPYEDTTEDLIEWLTASRSSLREVSKIVDTGHDVPKSAYRLLEALQADIAILMDKLKAKYAQKD